MALLGVASFVFDPGGAIAAPFGGETTMGDATMDGYVQRDIDARIQELQSIRDPQQYRAKITQLRGLYQNSYFLQHLVPVIDQQIKILDTAPVPNATEPPAPIT